MPPQEGDITYENSKKGGSTMDDNNATQEEGGARMSGDADVLTGTGTQTRTRTRTSRPENTFKDASFVSKLFFMWPYEILKQGMERTITEMDLPDVLDSESSKQNRIHFEKLWTDEVQRIETLKSKYPLNSKKRSNLRPSLIRALTIDFFKSTIIIQPLMLASSTARIVMSVALGYLIQSFVDKSNDGYIWASVLIVSNAVVLFEHHHVFLITWRKGMQYRIGAVASIFAKTLRLNSIGGTDAIPSGQIMNLVSNDVERFMMTTLFISYIIWAPLQAIAILIIGLNLIGPAFAIGIGLLLFISTPLQFYLSKRFAVLRSRVAAITDKRMTLVSQAIVGVRVMKMSGWEEEFEKRIAKMRKLEIRQIQKANRLKALNESVFFSVNIVVSIVIFVSHVFIFDGALTTRMVFTIFTLTNVLQLELTKHLSLGVMAGAECKVSAKRIQKFLEEPELIARGKDVGVDTSNVQRTSENVSDKNDDDGVLIKMSNVTCHWNSSDGASVSAGSVDESNSGSSATGTIALEDINIDFRSGELTCIVGSVGSGKSALLSCIVGELSTSEGTIERSYGSIAYATQDPWIMNGTIKDNIVMGKVFDPVFYKEIVAACGLNQDFTQFIDGDQTIVGDRGVQCSGGQRARIGLARALYRDADVVVLDDPLSAVDSRVGRIIFYSGILDLTVKRGKCVILATHQHQYIGEYRCALISNGKMKKIGTFTECVALSEGKLHPVSYNSSELQSNKTAQDEDMDEDKGNVDIPASDVEPMNDTKDKPEVLNTQEETKFSGLVSRATFLHYARSMGSIWNSVLLLILFTITQAISLGSIVALGRWSELDPDQQQSRGIVSIVLGLGGGVVLFSIIRSLTSFNLTVRASKRLHDTMTSSVLRAKVEFFDTNPSGRILNRFSADVGSNDDLLPATLFDFSMCAFLVVGALITAVTALPFILLAFPPLMWYFLKVRNIFVTSSREFKRLEGLARSPIFAMLSESISGIATIRSNGCVEYIKNTFENTHDAHGRAFWSFLASSRWLGFRMDSLMFLACSLASILAVLFSEKGWFGVDPVIFGLALSMLIQLGAIFQWTIRQSAEVVNQMVCVERVAEYSKLYPEGALSLASDQSHPNWPENGCMEVKDLKIRYRKELPPSLEKVSFTIASGQRVGVVGRTGSGKSTLVQALFRILEAERGSICIDGVDIKTLGLHCVRRGMSVINQYPVLFSGCTIRENLDPFDTYSDKEITDSLTDVQMIDAVNDLPEGIHSVVAESGSNFSVGERQLLCLARAILQKTKILVLDEPSANVDGRTDKLLQQAVNKSFEGATIISVAHRLDTIIDNDMVLVLGDGKVLEYGCPSELLTYDGAFSQMVNDTGVESSKELRRRAIESANTK